MKTSFEELPDSQWEFIKRYLPIQRKHKYDLRDILNGIFRILRTGSQWRNLAEKYPPWESVYYYYFRVWNSNGVLLKINAALNSSKVKKILPALYALILSRLSLLHLLSKTQGLMAIKKVNGRKRHLLVDTLVFF